MSRQEYGSVAETVPPPPLLAYRRVSEVSTETFALYERRRSSMRQLMSTGGIGYGKRRASSIAEVDALSMMPVNYKEALKSIATHITPATPTPGLPFLSLSEVIQTQTTLALLAWSTICSFAFTNVFVHVPAFAESVGLSAVDGARALSLTGLFMLLGNVTLGRVTDMIGPIRTLQITMCVLMVLMFMWPYCTSPESLSVLACLFGYCATTQSSVPLIILADAFRETSPDSILTLLGVLHVSKCPGYLFGPTIVGGLFDMFGNYKGGSIFTGTIMLVANLFLFTLPSTAEQTETVLKKHRQVVTAAHD
jgi:predicted MFS family arabinose efflux permease